MAKKASKQEKGCENIEHKNLGKITMAFNDVIFGW